ncbi:hypothetical protein DRW07_08575 [Alteromonas sediminis]|uniref:Uncharacterized protein n=1 Tax=Alteromonas sediminis TaxID=2259342 RepID=A0A3N5ZCD8_9ALTE|nr:hypothetical protein [Alteromonas sediminis]RPJ67558.1 hypothetical protein DRW07_08575 [Alteromonas sediminis]
MSKLDKEQVIAAFTEAYTKANGKAPQIEAKGGWFSVDGGKNMRLAQLDEMAKTLSADKATADTNSKEASKPKAKPATKAKAKKTKSDTGFSVKQYWAEQIKSDNAGAILPR